MLQLENLSLRRGGRLLLHQVNLRIHPGQRVGVTGANGSGKSSLFALIRGELSADAGELTLPPTWVIAHVAQETPAVERSALEYVLDGDRELREIETALGEAERAEDGHRQAELHGRLEAAGGYSARARASRLLSGLGFADTELTHPVAHFSGGWRMRLNLAQALMCRSDLLLLDEPTNHLDLDAVLWLEEWLCAYPGTLLLISHDRDFLDRVVTHVAHLEHEGLELYAGGYSDFELRRAERLAQQQAAHERQQREVQRVQAFVQRFRAKATKARQAQSRRRAASRRGQRAPAHVESPVQVASPPPGKVPSPLLKLEAAEAGHGRHTVLGGVAMTFHPGDRIGLLGPNGAGKSTLVRLIAGELSPSAGARELAADTRIGYFAQHQLEQLRGQDSPLVHLQRLDSDAPEQGLRDFLGSFGFHGEAALGPVAPLSGGEKARLVLALLVYQRPNLLLLDEPTNHLDLDMRHALAMALQEFAGALVVVSHDRHLLRTVTDDLWLVADGTARRFDGDLEEYRQWLVARRASPVEPNGEAAGNGEDRRQRRRDAAALRQRLKPMRDEAHRLEARLQRLGREKRRVEEALAEPRLYEGEEKERLKELLREQGRLEREVGEAEASWMEAQERLEAAEHAGT